MCRGNGSSNINEVIRAALNSLLFFTKRFCTHEKHQKHRKTPKRQKAQEHNQAKAQIAKKRTKIKNALKKHLSEKK